MVFEFDRRTKYFGTDIEIFYSEIHMIRDIKENAGLHITALAEKMNITKGAVSQMVKRLEKKGLVEKYSLDENLSKCFVRLTKKGEKADREHLRLHREADRIIFSILDTYSDKDIALINDFLIRANNKVSDLEKII